MGLDFPCGLSAPAAVSHRDLKVSNLLMTDKGCVKIGESQHLPPAVAALCRDRSSAGLPPHCRSLLQLISAWHAPTGCPLSP